MKNSNHRFTLIELLVVVAILAVLVSLLNSSFRNMAEKAQLISCAQNQKGLGVGMMLYSEDNNGNFPYCDSNNANLTRLNGWDESVAPYLGYVDLPVNCVFSNNETFPEFLCPSSEMTSASPTKHLKSYASSMYKKVDPHLISTGMIGWDGAIVNYGQVTTPSETILLGERWDPNNTIGISFEKEALSVRTYYEIFHKGTQNHYSFGDMEWYLCHNSDGTTNFAMVDGSVKTMHGMDVVTDPTKYNRQNMIHHYR